MNWNKEGQQVAGIYLGAYTITGRVQSSRVKYGGRVQHRVLLDTPLEVFGRVAEELLIDDEELFTGPARRLGIMDVVNKQQA
jgi:hypothetical protein